MAYASTGPVLFKEMLRSIIKMPLRSNIRPYCTKRRLGNQKELR